jgi:hypothetical protein
MTDIITRTRETLLAVVAQHDWPTPEDERAAVVDLLMMLARIDYEGDDDDYKMLCWTAACELMGPRILRNRRVAAFKRLATSSIVH